MKSPWIAMAEAFDHVLAIELHPGFAKEKLASEIQSGSIPAKAEHYYETECTRAEGNPIPPVKRDYFLPVRDINAKKGEIRVDLESSGLIILFLGRFTQNPWKDYCGYASNVMLGREQLLQRWPEKAISPLSKPVPSRKGIGGKPTKYDWAGAGGFMAWYITENDYPATQSELTKVLAKWFEDREQQPNKRDMERFVAALYESKGQ
jgi:hypothetical protein